MKIYWCFSGFPSCFKILSNDEKIFFLLSRLFIVTVFSLETNNNRKIRLRNEFTEYFNRLLAHGERTSDLLQEILVYFIN